MASMSRPRRRRVEVGLRLHLRELHLPVGGVPGIDEPQAVADSRRSAFTVSRRSKAAWTSLVDSAAVGAAPARRSARRPRSRPPGTPGAPGRSPRAGGRGRRAPSRTRRAGAGRDGRQLAPRGRVVGRVLCEGRLGARVALARLDLGHGRAQPHGRLVAREGGVDVAVLAGAVATRERLRHPGEASDPAEAPPREPSLCLVPGRASWCASPRFASAAPVSATPAPGAPPAEAICDGAALRSRAPRRLRLPGSRRSRLGGRCGGARRSGAHGSGTRRGLPRGPSGALRRGEEHGVRVHDVRGLPFFSSASSSASQRAQ